MDFPVTAIQIIIIMKNKDFRYSPDVLLAVTILLQCNFIILGYARIIKKNIYKIIKNLSGPLSVLHSQGLDYNYSCQLPNL